MNKYYFVRFDDICPTMEANQFDKAKTLMEKYNIKPLLGVIPLNLDSDQFKTEYDESFWEKIRDLQTAGWSIAMHGCNHVYNQDNPKTMICGKKHSEFAGNSYARQVEIIRKGKEEMEKHGVFTDMFFAPAHSYDKNTLKALAANDFLYNIDGLSDKPYKQCGIINIPCRSFGVPLKGRNRINIAVNHTSEWSNTGKVDGYENLKRFCTLYEGKISNFENIKKMKCGKFIFQKVSEKIYRLKVKCYGVIRKIFK